MKIIDKLMGGEPTFSFEFFPPKNEQGMQALFDTVARLKEYDPAYVSVTYGAGGSTRRLTVELVERIQRETGIDAMAHLTCVGSTREEIGAVLRSMREAKVENVLALRGDPPKGQETFVATEGGFGYSNELTRFIRDNYDFCVAGACYPEVHPEASSAEADLEHLKRKVDAGAQLLISQLFFDNRDFFRFVDRCRSAGIEVPIIAGIMPVTNLKQVKRFTQMCGATLPQVLLDRLEETGGDPERVRAIGIAYATQQCFELLDGGVAGIHFYTLNRSTATVHVLEALRDTEFGSSPSLEAVGPAERVDPSA